MATFTTLAPTSRTALLADLEGLWQRFDELVGTLGPDDWSGKHGQHWSFTLRPCVQRMGRAVFQHAYHLKPGWIWVGVLFDAHAHFTHYRNGSYILIGGCRDNPLQLKLSESIVD